MSRIALALFAVCCLAALAAAQPIDDAEDGQLLVRARRSPAGVYRQGVRGSVKRRARPSLYAARSHEAPAYAAPEDDAEAPASALSGEDVQADDAPLEAPRSSRARRPSSSEDDAGAPPAYGNTPRSGTNAIATSYARGDGASSNSHALAYGGNFSGGQFKHRFQRN